jgi:hypothetical protein
VAVALEALPGDEFNPTSYRGSFSPPPDGVPFGGIATLAVNFADLPDLDLDLDLPEQLILSTPVFDSMTLGSEELASWTWSSSDGSEPIRLEISISATGSNGPERVGIRCDVTDDGEFAFPSEYLDLARERLGSEITAIPQITRQNRGQVPLAGESLYWRSTHNLFWQVAVVD